MTYGLQCGCKPGCADKTEEQPLIETYGCETSYEWKLPLQGWLTYHDDIECGPIYRVRLPLTGVAYLAWASEMVFCILNAGLALEKDGGRTASYSLFYMICAPFRIGITSYTGIQLQSKSAAHLQGVCSSPYVFALDTLMLVGLICWLSFGVMQIGSIFIVDGASISHPLQALAKHWLAVCSVVANLLVVISINFMFRMLTLAFHFSRREYLMFKGSLAIAVLTVLGFGVIHGLTGKARTCDSVYILSLLLWRREMFATLSRWDNTNKFVGIRDGYLLHGMKSWYGSSLAADHPPYLQAA